MSKQRLTILSANDGQVHLRSGPDAKKGTADSITVIHLGKEVFMIYLDNAATSLPKPESVYQALDRFARTDLANPGRAGHKMALAAERILDDARHLLNQLFHGEGPERFVFTLNCTDALNMAFKGILADGAHAITTEPG